MRESGDTSEFIFFARLLSESRIESTGALVDVTTEFAQSTANRPIVGPEYIYERTSMRRIMLLRQWPLLFRFEGFQGL
jgi:hypothetical protein